MTLSAPSHQAFGVMMADADGPCRTLLTKVFAALEDDRQDFALAAWCKVQALLREGAGADDAAISLREAAARLAVGQAKALAAA